MPSLVLRNADFRTMDRQRPSAEAALIRGGRFAAVGADADVRAAAGPHYEDIDCGGDLLLPAFIDAHIHLLAYAASLVSVDCTPRAAPDIASLLTAIAARAAVTPKGRWIRAVGFRESDLRERRHPTRWELDTAAPAHPMRLLHASGHGCVLNSRALALAGITVASEEPPGGMIGRRLEDGEPDGLLLGMNAAVERAVPPLAYDDLRAQVAEANRRLLGFGVTAVQDMGVQNDAASFRLFQRLREDGAVTVDVTPAVGIEPFLRGERPPGWSGMVKLVIEDLGEALHPDSHQLAEQLHAVQQRGARAAVHCIGQAAIEQAITAFEDLARSGPIQARRHRLEHAALCTPEQARRAAALGLLIVCNPGFLAESGDRYLRELSPHELPLLHNLATFTTAGIPAAIGSDAPVARPDALGSIAAAVTRRTANAQRLPGATASVEAAVLAHTRNAAIAGGQASERGVLRPGAVADLVRLPKEALQFGQERRLPRPAVMLRGVWQAFGEAVRR